MLFSSNSQQQYAVSAELSMDLKQIVSVHPSQRSQRRYCAGGCNHIQSFAQVEVND